MEKKTPMIPYLIQLLAPACFSLVFASQAFAGTCCHVPTVWTIKNQDSAPVIVACQLEKSVAWTGKPIAMETGTIASGGVYEHTWGSDWYSDGMGMIPGKWICKIKAPDNHGAEIASGKLSLATDWGENVTIVWKKEKLTVAGINVK
jgi:hypothetical protein